MSRKNNKKPKANPMTKKQRLERLQKLQELINDRINSENLEIKEIDKLWDEMMELLKIHGDPVYTTCMKNHRWNANHLKIKQAIDQFIKETNTLPSAYAIARKIGLSRQTVSKHLKEYDTHPLFQEELRQHEFAANMLLERAFAMASKGDLKALRFFVNTIEKRKQVSQPNTQNNFIQINNIYVNEETLKALPADKRETIEEIILSENLKIRMSNKLTLESDNSQKVDKS